jgi:hypothetical protein
MDSTGSMTSVGESTLAVKKEERKRKTPVKRNAL